ncbi:FecCD family ABC transporter permease [Corynebacterium auriscanis]|uniref:FecCD family ABC transporter permease n=1 Tax=Corynebacterium auriscanis TaxID=99807 RepID=UPI00224553A1|nr:iron chelate uptake ABC transporter family permease subunit [Corynebacterium auriscanis]MCX2162764.1 iron chelate uptake ABC transporter family permease subunit [Corynebacterium auriscanis]
MSSPRSNSMHDKSPAPGSQPRFAAIQRRELLRSCLLPLTLGILVFILLALSVAIGEYTLTLPRVCAILLGDRSSRFEATVVLSWRMPRAITGLAVGAALGLSGAITQSLTRNGLASPDILGVTAGASAAAVTVIIVGPTTGVLGWLSGAGIPVVAFCGATASAAVVWFLSFRGGRPDPARLVVIGILLTAMLGAYINFLMVRAKLLDAAATQFWLTGSLTNSTWARTWPAVIVALVAIPVAWWLAFQFRALLLGTELAQSLGQRTRVTQLVALGVAIILAAVAVAAAGPIGFVAFAAPHVARMLAGTPAPPLVTSMLTGAVLLLAADLFVRTVTPTDIPVGLITSSCGGLFLMFLLIHRRRKEVLA